MDIDSKPESEQQEDLLLSFNEKSGIYSAVNDNDPHQKLNAKNAILINTKNPIYF
jgi:hypothetical protein